MILLIDAGNTRAKLAWIRADERERSAPPQPLHYGDLASLGDHLPQAPGRILGSNVAGAAIAQALEEACRSRWNLPIEWCDTRHGTTLLHNPYAQPGQLGSDRWLGLLGLQQRIAQQPAWRAGTPYILASFGTATTVDTLRHQSGGPGATPQATFLGGLILPGVTLMTRSLFTGTAQLPLAGGHGSDFPTGTQEAIASGVAAAQAGALLRQWQLARRLSGIPPKVFVAGGGWASIAHEVQQALTRTRQDLHLAQEPPRWLDGPVLDGLACLARGPA